MESSLPSFALVRTRRDVLRVGALVLLGPLLGACSRPTGQVKPSTAGLPDAPELVLSRFDDLPAIKLSEQRGKLVFLNFWASWCVPCKEEMPGFERVWQQYKERGVQLLGANVNDLDADARRFLQQDVHVSYPVGKAKDEDAARLFEVSGLPTSILITQDGKIAKKWLGSLGDDKLRALFDQYL